MSMRSTLILRSSLVAAIAACAVLSGCHSTHLAAVWKDPTAGPLHFRKPIVIFVSKSETFRRTMEDKLAARIPHAIPSYRVLQSTDGADGAAIRQQLADAGFDGAIIMRVVQVNEELTYTPGAYWYGAPYGFAGYWRTAWGYPYDPAYVNENVIVSMETEIYNLKNDKLLWAARSETTNPQSVNKLEDSVIRHIIKALEKEGMLTSDACARLPLCASAVLGN
jgi:hypothetical protein